LLSDDRNIEHLEWLPAQRDLVTSMNYTWHCLKEIDSNQCLRRISFNHIANSTAQLNSCSKDQFLRRIKHRPNWINQLLTCIALCQISYHFDSFENHLILAIKMQIAWKVGLSTEHPYPCQLLHWNWTKLDIKRD
jgi:hypothetical protein